jgi:L-fuconolactonase
MSSARAIDAHVHVVHRQGGGELLADRQPGTPHATFGPEALRHALAADGFDATILIQLAPTTEETLELLALASATSFVAGVVGWVDLTAPDVRAAIAALRAAPGGDLLVALRHRVHAETDPDWLDRLDVRRGLAAVAESGLAFHLSVRTRELRAATEVARALPELRLVLDHLARPPIASGDLTGWGRALLALAEQPNVSATISGLVSQAPWHTWSLDDLRHPVELAVDAFGPQRLMVGSDWPLCLSVGSYSDATDTVRLVLSDLPALDQAQILGTTAERVYRVERGGSAGRAQTSPPGAVGPTEGRA